MPWFESEMVPVTTVELHTKMVELAGEDEVYSIKYMTRKLEKQYEKTMSSANKMANQA